MSGEAAAPSPREQMEALRRLEQRGDLRELIVRGKPLLERFPDATSLLQMLGIAHARLGEPAEGAALFRRVIAIEPGYAAGHVNLGNCLRDLGDRTAAIASFEAAIAIDPAIAQAHHNLGNVLRDLGRNAAALDCFDRAVALLPGYASAHGQRGAALSALGRSEAAVDSYRCALALDPNLPDVHNNLAIALRQLGRFAEAIAASSAELARNPAHDGARARRLFLLARVCDWDAMGENLPYLPMLGIRGAVVSPYMMTMIEDEPARHRMRAERYAASVFPAPVAPVEAPSPAPDGRLRIGYFSADFHDHATMQLMARLFEVHDRTAFDIHAFSYGADADDPMRRRLLAAVEHFHDVRSLDDRAIVALARRQGIDIAVDLKGYTADMRTSLFAYRAAPVQISYLGYPGTIGAPFIDYVIADRTVIPPDSLAYYSEAPIWLPHSYQVNDDRRPISDRPMARADHGLPERGFVFASFNSSYKITAEPFAIWMRLLQRVEGSVLWLLGEDGETRAHLREHARRSGVDLARLVFAPKMAAAEHLARQRLADLFLDSFIYTAHTTASDALWAGLPILTRAGKGFAARVCASLLHAAGLPELVTDDAAAYERAALRLATDAGALAEVRARLAACRDTTPLFDSSLFARHIEEGYRQAHARHCAGLAPAPITVQP